MQIPMDITFRGMAANTAIKAAVSTWAAKLERVYERIQRCDVVLEVPHHHQSKGREFHIRIVLTVPGAVLVVSRDPGTDDAHEDIHVAIRDSFRAARRQLEDHVRRLRGDVKAHEGPGDSVAGWDSIDEAPRM
jgi:ribosome-associated translation inhibitor RaiA